MRRRPASAALQWPTLPARLVADLLAGHSAVALALGALIYLVCLTGTLCVFIDELQLWEQPTPVSAAFSPADSDRLVAEAVALAGGPSHAPLIFLRAPLNPRERTVVSIGERQWTPGPGGRLVPLRLPWSGFLERLHYTLTLPGPWGEALVGVLGMGLFSLLLSGVLAHPRILRDAFVLRLGGGRRLQEADLHNRLGVWGLPFHLAVTLTGALFGLSNMLMLVIAALGYHGSVTAASRPLEGPPPVHNTRPAPAPSIAAMVARSRALRPGSQLYYFSVSGLGTRGERVAMEVTAPGRLPRGEETYFDGEGRLVGRTRYASGALGLQLYSASAEVHFGFFGGLPVRLAYGLLGLSLCWVSSGGVSIYFARRRDRGRPAPRLERAWSAWVWGSPAALALAACPTGIGPATVFWTCALLLPLASQLPGGPEEAVGAERLCRSLLGLALVAAAVLRGPSAIANPVALPVETVALLTGLALALSGLGPAWRRRTIGLRGSAAAGL